MVKINKHKRNSVSITTVVKKETLSKLTPTLETDMRKIPHRKTDKNKKG